MTSLRPALLINRLVMKMISTVKGVAEPVQIRYQQYSLDERRNACVKVCPEISMPIGSSGLYNAQKEEFSFNLIYIAESTDIVVTAP